jgi:hypothetical protein
MLSVPHTLGAVRRHIERNICGGAKAFEALARLGGGIAASVAHAVAQRRTQITRRHARLCIHAMHIPTSLESQYCRRPCGRSLQHCLEPYKKYGAQIAFRKEKETLKYIHAFSSFTPYLETFPKKYY